MHTERKVGSECGGSKCGVTAQIKRDEGRMKLNRHSRSQTGEKAEREQKREEVVTARDTLGVWSERA